MNADVLLADLRARGIVLVAEGDRLRCRPRSLLTTEDLTTLRANKPALLDRLANGAGARRVICYACHGSCFWLSIHGVTVCGPCHPPASLDLVVKWIDETGRSGDDGWPARWVLGQVPAVPSVDRPHTEFRRNDCLATWIVYRTKTGKLDVHHLMLAHSIDPKDVVARVKARDGATALRIAAADG